MEIKYMDFVCKALSEHEIGKPIYLHRISECMAKEYGISHEKAADEVGVAYKRIMEMGLVPELRIYQSDILYRTTATPFGECGIDREQLIYDKYLANDMGYETGLSILHKMGLTSQMPRERVIVSNEAGSCEGIMESGVVVCSPKVRINAENKYYFMLLDVLEILDDAPIDVSNPYEVIGEYMERLQLDYHKLSVLAGTYYNPVTIIQLERVLEAGMKNKKGCGIPRNVSKNARSI